MRVYSGLTLFHRHFLGFFCEEVSGPSFLSKGGHVPQQYFCDPLFDDEIFYDPPPPEAAMLKKHVTLTRVTRKICLLGAISLNKIFSKICGYPITS